MSKATKIVGGVVILLIVAFLAVPAIVHSAVKSKIDEKLKNEFGDLAHYESVTINWSPLGATLTNLALGAPNPAAGNRPAINISSIDVVLNSVTDSAPRFSSVIAHKIDVNISVDQKGESSVAKLIREKQLSKRKEPLTIDLLKMDNIVINTYVAKANSNPSTTPPDSVLKVAQISSTNLVLPIPGQLLGHEQWIPTEISSIEASGPGAVPTEPSAKNSTVQLPLRISKISFEINQAEDESAPVRLRKFRADGAECMVEGANDQPGGFKTVINSIQKGFGIQEPENIKTSSPKPPKPQGTGLLIEDFQAADARIEMRGNGGAFWRLARAKIEAGNLAFGDQVAAKASGFIKLQSATESNSAPGQVTLAITDLSGSFPRSSFKCTYTIDRLPPAAFSDMGASQKVTIKQGTVSVVFGGGAVDGNLNMEGSVTLSDDFELQDAITNLGAKMTLGKPIQGVTIDGTLEHPQIHLPNELAMLSEFMGTILLGGPFTILDGTVGKIPVVGTVVNEATKTGSKVLSKIPIIGGLFKKGDEKKDEQKDK